MFRLLVLSTVASVVAADGKNPGGYTSFSESALKRGASALVPTLITDIKNIVIPGVNKLGVSIDPIRFQDVSIGSYDVSVVPDGGVEVSLKDMSNVIAHTNITVDVLFVKCKGQVWASAAGASFTAMNTIVVDEDGTGKLNTVTPPGGFDAGTIEMHHQMEGFICEAAADVLHVVNSIVIDLIKNTLQSHLTDIVAKAVDIPTNLLLHEIEQPPALGFGKEKFKLDNSYLSVSYADHRITHLHKGEFKSTLHPVESTLQPPALAASGERDVQFAFSDYLVNTLFDSMFTEHIGESQIKIPFIKTIFDKECHRCPIVLKSTFTSPARQTFSQGTAEAHLTGMTLEIGALNKESTVLPMVTLSVNASAGAAFSLEQTASNYGVKTALTLGDFQQELVISHIGKVDLSDLTRDVELVITSLFDTLNKDIPTLPLPAIAGVKLGKPQFSIDERVLLLEADLVMPKESTTSVVIV